MVTTKIQGSVEQENFWEELVNGSSHLILQARAGTGKTFSCIEGAHRLLDKHPELVIKMVAYNKSIATELQMKVPEQVEAQTMHSLGLHALRQHAYRSGSKMGKIGNNWKTRNILEGMGYKVGKGREFKKDVLAFVQIMEKVVSLAKNTMLQECYSQTEFDALITHYGIHLNGKEEEVLRVLPRVLDKSKEFGPGIGIDFDDMIWLPIALNIDIPKVDVLFVDEAQDLNRSRQLLAMKSARRIVLVGDDRQAIYGFTGADAESMKNMEQELGEVKVMPLTITRRCPTSHIELAKEIVPDIKAMEDAEKGSIDNIAPGTLADHAQVGDLVVCRMNAPLMRTALRFLQKEIPVKIQGRDFQRSLVNMIKKIAGKKTTVDELQLKVDKYLDRETSRLLTKKRPTETQLELLHDQVSCIKYLCLGQRTVQDVLDRIDSLFVDAEDVGDVVLLSSVHRAKGLEAGTVFILEPKLMPHPMAKMDWEKQQEMNIKYVALTRSLDRLVFVG
tara:strand:+ start:5433 stop:6941 length:1509 start_codon:yes stop_codon:yes gene_type:complete